uniref:Nucleoporin NUP42 n=1 Tax=Amblyomma sculptum TaxID=1581419 RepID=A0A1E1XTE8_AMBSC
MSVCWYYMEGRCRFGDRCRFLHPPLEYEDEEEYVEPRRSRSGKASHFDFNAALQSSRHHEQDEQYRKESYQRRYGDTYHSPPRNRHTNSSYYEYEPQQQNRFQVLHDTSRSDISAKAAAGKFDFNKAFQQVTKTEEHENSSEVQTSDESTVVSDMKQWQAGGQWLFSSYGPFGNAVSYPGFSDISMEESRLDYYNAFRAGTVSDWVVRMKQAALNVQQNIQYLMSMPSDVKNCLKRLRDDAAGVVLSTPSSKPIAGLLPTPAASIAAPVVTTLQPQLQPQLQATPVASYTTKATPPVQSKPLTSMANTQRKEEAKNLYTPEEDLTTEEKEQFLAQHFTPGKIPLRPPPRQYCALD